MPNTRNVNAVRLEFAPGSLAQTNWSGAAFTGDDFSLLAGPMRAPNGENAVFGDLRCQT